MKTLILSDGRQLDYELERKNVKNINYRANEEGYIRVSAPQRVPLKDIESGLEKHADFFFKAFKRMSERERRHDINILDSKTVRWLGRDYPVRVIANSREKAVIDENECRVFTKLEHDDEYVLGLVRKAVAERFLLLCRELNDEVRSELESFGFTPPPTVITVKDMKSRWGSCSYYRGHISINVRLAAYPRETVKSVFWHEYAHYQYHDHSKNFYAFLDKYCPEYRKWNALLKE